MNDRELENLIGSSFEKVPETLWLNLKKELARDIVMELIEKLERQKEPKKRESIDRINEETEKFLTGEDLYVKGA